MATRKTTKNTPKDDNKGEFRSGNIAGTTFVSGVTFNRKALQYAEVDGMAIFEGDIILGKAEDLRRAGQADASNMVLHSIGITGQQFRWPNATIPYDIDSGMPNQQRITDAIAHWEANTRIRFVLRTAANASQYPDYVHFQSGGGCSSWVGKIGGQQDLTLGTGCNTGNAIHEIGHAVGLYHEQSREDRDTFVRIEWANIDPSKQHNFDQHIADGDDLGPYDYGSIMHYPATAFTINGQPTIVPLQPLPPGVVMGQRNGLSQGDIDGVHMMYPMTFPTIKEMAKDVASDPVLKRAFDDPTRTTIKEVRKDPIVDTIKEVGKDPIQDTLKEAGKDPLYDTFKEVGKDPIQDTLIERTYIPFPGPQFGTIPAQTSPFVLATPSQYGGQPQAQASKEAMAQDLVNTIAALDKQLAELLVAYNQATQDLNVLNQG